MEEIKIVDRAVSSVRSNDPNVIRLELFLVNPDPDSDQSQIQSNDTPLQDQTTRQETFYMDRDQASLTALSLVGAVEKSDQLRDK